MEGQVHCGYRKCGGGTRSLAQGKREWVENDWLQV